MRNTGAEELAEADLSDSEVKVPEAANAEAGVLEIELAEANEAVAAEANETVAAEATETHLTGLADMHVAEAQVVGVKPAVSKSARRSNGAARRGQGRELANLQSGLSFPSDVQRRRKREGRPHIESLAVHRKPRVPATPCTPLQPHLAVYSDEDFYDEPCPEHPQHQEPNEQEHPQHQEPTEQEPTEQEHPQHQEPTEQEPTEQEHPQYPEPTEPHPEHPEQEPTEQEPTADECAGIAQQLREKAMALTQGSLADDTALDMLSSVVPNIGNTCYLGSALLLLSQCNLPTSLADATQMPLNILKRIQTGTEITPEMVQQIQAGVMSKFQKDTQHDSNEVPLLHTPLAAATCCKVLLLLPRHSAVS